MNKVYKVIWSKVRNCYIVVSELAKRNGKCSSSLNKKIIASFLAAGLVALAPVSVQAEYSDPASQGGTEPTRQTKSFSAGAEDTDAVNVAQLKLMTAVSTDNRNVGIIVNERGIKEITSPFIHVEGVETAAANYKAELDNYLQSEEYTSLPYDEQQVALAEKIKELRAANNFANATGDSSIAIGKGAKATNERSVAVGQYATSSGIGSFAMQKGKATGEDATAWGNTTEAKGDYSTAFGINTTASKWGSTAFGYKTTADNTLTTAFGYETKATGYASTAFGYQTTAEGDYSTAWGENTLASGWNSTAFGQNTTAEGNYSTAWGRNTIASGWNSTAFGKNTTAGVYKLDDERVYARYERIMQNGQETLTLKLYRERDREYIKDITVEELKTLTIEDFNNAGQVAFGHATTAASWGTMAWGLESLAIGDQATAFGYKTVASMDRATAWGDETTASGYDSTAWGYKTKATNHSATAFGAGTTASGATATAWGGDTVASGRHSTAFGTETKAGGSHSAAFGYKTEVSDKGYAATAFGWLTKATNTVATAFGYSTEASGVGATAWGLRTKALGERSTAWGEDTMAGTTAGGVLSTAWGKNTEAIGNWSTAWGYNTKATNQLTTAFGYNTTASGFNATAFGQLTEAIGNWSTAWGYNTKATNQLTTAFGYNTEASGYAATAFGLSSKAYAENSLAALGGIVGESGKDTGINSAAIGQGAIVTADNALAFGGYATATLSDSVALGSESKADRDAGKSGYDMATGKESAKLDDPTWTATRAAISIGNPGNEVTRQITGVAAGSADTDAVNVAQLKLSMVEIQAGDNISVLTSYGSDGHLIYTISGMKGGAVDSDDRVVTLTPAAPDNKDEKSITSPYLHINGLNDAPAKDYAQAQAIDSIAMGRSATAGELATRGVAIGKGAEVHGEDTVALGPNAQASNHYATALGADAKASIPTSVALGSQSVTTEKDTAGFYSGRVGYDVATDSTYRGADRYDSTWQSTDGSVSVGGGIDPYTGAPAMTRRISNVAAGVYDTDVVNVAQLKRVTLYRTDYRSTAIGTDAEGNTEITSPYINVHGVKEAAEAKTLLNVYKTYESYENTLTKNVQTLTQEKADLTRDVNTLATRISDVDAKMKALTDPNSEAYKTLADEKAYLVGEHTTLSSELKEITEELSETEARLGTAAEDYKKAQELVDSQARAEGKDSVAVGSKSVASGDQTIAMGTDNAITGDLSTAVGAGNTVTGNQSIAVGTGHEVHGSNSGTFGDPNIVAADYSYVVGNNNTVGSTALKDGDDIPTENIFVLGNDNNIEAGKQHVYVLGSEVTKTESRSVFLGDGTGYVPEGKTTAGMSDYSSETINGKTYNFAGGKPVGVVSVGNENETRRIQNVAAGKISADSTDAINGSQLYSAIENVNTNLGDQISNVDSRATKGIAGAAALAALHPLDFDPDDKLTFAAGMGHYRGKTAAALGLFYRADEKVMFSLGGTVGNSENMVNAGVSFSLDRTPRVTGSRTALTKEVVALREHVARQDAQIAELTALVRQLAGNAGVNMPAASSLPAAMPALFPDNLDNKWAYDKLEELEQQGYIKGYAGHTLTRSQFAAALDMAMKRGAKLEERLVKAFEPELSHVRVAHVEGNGNEEGEWYERPRFSYDKLEKKHEIEKKNARIVTAKQK